MGDPSSAALETIRRDVAALVARSVDDVGPDVDLIQTGWLDSVSFVELLLKLEQRFGLRVDLAAVELDSFRSVRQISRFVLAQTGDRGLFVQDPPIVPSPAAARVADAPHYTVRPMRAEDVPAVAALYARVRQRPDLERNALTRLPAIFLEHPWRNLPVHSLVGELADGRIAGFLGAMPRPLVIEGRPVLAAIISHYMVDPPARGTLMGTALLRRFLDGPQDVSLADDATEPARRIWERLGGSSALLLSLHWTRLLSPSRALLRIRRRRRPPTRAERLLDPGCRLIDAALRLVMRRGLRFTPALRSEPLNLTTIVSAVASEAFVPEAVRPSYSAESLGWLLRAAGALSTVGPLVAQQLLDSEGKLAGWFVCGVRRGEIAECLQLGARRDQQSAVFEALLCTCQQAGAVAVRGRVVAAMADVISSRQAFFRRDGLWTLVHARDKQLLSLLLRGDAWFTRLDGEWWIRLSGPLKGSSSDASAL